MNDSPSSHTGQSQSNRFALSTRQSLLILLLLCLVLSAEIIAFRQMPDGLLHVAFLDVGQGDAILVQSPGGHQILIDGGPDPSRLSWALGKQLPMWDRSLDMVVLTHADNDHMAGLIPLFERYRVETVLTSRAVLESEQSASWREAVDRSDAAIAIAERGLRIILDQDTELTIVHPPSNSPSVHGHDNNLSVVLHLEFGQARFLLTGDLEAEGERDLQSTNQSLTSQVLKVSHHGAGGATSQGFLAAVQPKLAVIQVGADNRFGHPADATLDLLESTGAAVLRTDRDGTIELTTDGTGLHVHSDG